MKQIVMLIAALALVCLSGQGQEKSAAVSFSPPEVERAFEQIPTKPPTNKNIVEQEHYNVAVARVAGRNGDFDVPQSRIVGVKSHVPDEFIVVTTRVLGLDPTDVRSLTDAYTKLYQQIPIIVNFFRRYMPGCGEVSLREIAPMMGIRESRRIMGDYVLSKEDVVEGRRFDDAVSMGGYHVDIHNPSGTWVHSADVEAYTIPFRSLVARGVEGLLMAGKCLSATHEAVASTRVIPICMGQGQAVGTAAALAVKARTSVREIGLGRLQDALISQGAELGQSLGEPDEELIERIGVMPKNNHVVLPEQDQVSGLETAWVK